MAHSSFTVAVMTTLIYSIFSPSTWYFWTSLVVQMVKSLPAMQKTRVPCLGVEDSLEKGMATYSSTLAWKIPGMGSLVGSQSMGLQGVKHDWATNTHTHTHKRRVPPSPGNIPDNMSPEMQEERAQTHHYPAHGCRSSKSGSGLKTPGESIDNSVNPRMSLPGPQCTVRSFTGLAHLSAPLPDQEQAGRQLFLYFPASAQGSSPLEARPTSIKSV